ncbi:MAG: TetR/AcrR family transcriptional regulator [Oscillospiraceae bacterium]|nr:TetR/AcrR family transcriptional regulator [Oscillospiraceae bacterium]
MKDRRVSRTEKSIRNVFLDLLPQKSIYQITVSEIAALANIGRGTFYAHYTDIFDLLSQIEDEVIENVHGLFISAYAEKSDGCMELWLNAFLDYVTTNKDIFLSLFSGNVCGHFEEKLKESIKEDIKNGLFPTAPVKNWDLETRNRYYHVLFLSDSAIGMFRYWINNFTGNDWEHHKKRFIEIVLYCFRFLTRD